MTPVHRGHSGDGPEDHPLKSALLKETEIDRQREMLEKSKVILKLRGSYLFTERTLSDGGLRAGV